MHPLLRAQLLPLSLLIVTDSHLLWIELAWRCAVQDLSAAAQQHLLRSIDHARVLVVVTRRLLLILAVLLLLQHLLILHLLQLLRLLLLQLHLLRSGRLH